MTRSGHPERKSVTYCSFGASTRVVGRAILGDDNSGPKYLQVQFQRLSWRPIKTSNLVPDAYRFGRGGWWDDDG